MTETPPPAHTPESWGAASRGYSEKVAPFVMRPFAEAHVERLEVDAESEALEVGAGSGALTEVLCSRVKSLLATDYAPEMIEILKERLRASGTTNVQCEVMDGQALQLEDDRFDAAASSFALMLFADRARGFSELNRVVRPGGRVVVSGWTGPDRFGSFEIFLAAMEAALPDLPPPPAPPAVFSLADPDDFRSQMEAGGLRDVEVEYVSRELEVGTVDEFWRMLTAGAPPVQVLFDHIGPEGRERLEDALRSIVTDRYGSGPIVVTNVATLGSGRAS
jgi:SAM-dependent methyltransferase